MNQAIIQLLLLLSLVLQNPTVPTDTKVGLYQQVMQIVTIMENPNVQPEQAEGVPETPVQEEATSTPATAVPTGIPNAQA